MIVFLILIGVAIAIGAIVMISNAAAATGSEMVNVRSYSQKESAATSSVYKSKEFREFEIHGASHAKLNPEVDAGSFLGELRVVSNPHDKYAVAVFREDGKRLGYVPKGNFRLNNSLRQWHGGAVFCWGNLWYEDYKSLWRGHVAALIGFDIDAQNKIRSFKQMEKQMALITNSVDKVKLAERVNEIGGWCSDNFGVPFNGYDLSKLLNTEIRNLAKEKKWQEVLQLHTDYLSLFEQKKESFPDVTLKRIEQAHRAVDNS